MALPGDVTAFFILPIMFKRRFFYVHVDDISSAQIMATTYWPLELALGASVALLSSADTFT